MIPDDGGMGRWTKSEEKGTVQNNNNGCRNGFFCLEFSFDLAGKFVNTFGRLSKGRKRVFIVAFISHSIGLGLYTATIVQVHFVILSREKYRKDKAAP
jgi:hypothetical protein